MYKTIIKKKEAMNLRERAWVGLVGEMERRKRYNHILII